MKRRKVCACCGGNFGLIRHRSWLASYCSKKCRETNEQRLAAEIKRRKAFLQYLAQG